MKKISNFLIAIIKYYQYNFSADHKQGAVGFCKFTPSCSEYCKQCLQKYSLFKALFKGTKRVLKCHPWHKGGIDLP